MLALAVAAGGCSVQMGSLVGKDDTTASITPTSLPGVAATSKLPPETDLIFTRAAVAEVLTRGTKDASQPWENPKSGARGTVTAIADAYTQDGFTCRDFLASYVRDGSEAWLQGEACRIHQGQWEVKNLRSWKRT